jgi:hypothetical protein
VVGGLATWIHRREHQGRTPGALRALAPGIVVAYGLTILFVAPYLAYTISHGLPRLPASWPFVYTTDVANIIVPSA